MADGRHVRVSPDGDIAQRFDDGPDVAEGWLLLHVVDGYLKMTVLSDDDVAGWPRLVDVTETIRDWELTAHRRRKARQHGMAIGYEECVVGLRQLLVEDW